MRILRLAIISIAVLLVFQVDTAHGVVDLLSALRPVTKTVQPIIQPIIPLLDLLPFNLTAPVKTLLTLVNLDNYPNLDSDIDKYNSYTEDTRPKCCQPEQFSCLFRFLYDFFFALETIGKEFTLLLCDLLQFVSPLTCQENIRQNVQENQCNNTINVEDIPSLGCIVDSVFGKLFGKLGILAAKIVVGGLGPLDFLDGCLITGVAQVFNYAAYETPNDTMGDAVGPIAVLSTVLGFIFSITYCVGAPFDRFIGDAYKWSCEKILDICEVQYEKGLW